METKPDVRARIIAAADKLYQEGEKSALPKVEEVRRAARASMGDTSAVKSWMYCEKRSLLHTKPKLLNWKKLQLNWRQQDSMGKKWLKNLLQPTVELIVSRPVWEALRCV